MQIVNAPTAAAAFATAVFAAAAAAAAWWAVGRVRVLVERHAILDVPNERSSHCRPMARGGGLAIVLVTGAGLLLVQALWAPWPPLALVGCLAGALLVAGVSWVDDLRGLPVRVRLPAHAAAAALAVAAVGPWTEVALPGIGVWNPGILGIPLAWLWVVGMINIYNFMDGIDGLAGSQAVAAAAGWCVIGLLSGNAAVAVLAALLAGSSLGFLAHNWAPARIFMGDVGSTFLGYSLAVLPLLAGQRDPEAALAGVLLLWPFLFDGGFTILRRLRRGENLLVPHRAHLYQRLVTAGQGHAAVTSTYAALAAAGLAAAVLWAGGAAGAALAGVTVVPLLAPGLVVYTHWCERARQVAGAAPQARRAVEERQPAA